MAERIKITVHPPPSHPDVLTVLDAMRQVLDIFELLSAGGERTGVVWALVRASTNTPLTVEGEARSFNKSIDAVSIARTQKAGFSRNLSMIRTGAIPADWSDSDNLRTITRLMMRNVNGIGETDIDLSDQMTTVAITPDFAYQGLQTLRKSVPTHELLDDDRAREEHGAIEGRLLNVGHDYNQPAIRIEERKSRQAVWCRVSEEERTRIAQETDFDDVWDHRRVIVRGLIRYNANGEIIRCFAKSVERIASRQVPVEKLRDPEFTGGLTVREYLERFREGELGG